jgi:hypothetical protein
MGDISSIELDWHEGVFIETEASPHSDPRLPSAVYFDVKCCLCEWAYTAGGVALSDGVAATIGHKTPDVEGALGWAASHRKADEAHAQARSEFRRKKSI